MEEASSWERICLQQEQSREQPPQGYDELLTTEDFQDTIGQSLS